MHKALHGSTQLLGRSSSRRAFTKRILAIAKIGFSLITYECAIVELLVTLYLNAVRLRHYTLQLEASFKQLFERNLVNLVPASHRDFALFLFYNGKDLPFVGFS
jgi:hypothetical protein